MKTGREDYEGEGKDRAIPAEEPTFILRAQDPLGIEAARFWCQRALERGVSKAVVEQAMRQIDHMEAWPYKKLPDAEHIKDPVPLFAAFDARLLPEIPDSIEKIRELAHYEGRAEGFTAGKRSLETTLQRLQDSNRDLRSENAGALDDLAKVRAQLAEAAETNARLLRAQETAEAMS